MTPILVVIPFWKGDFDQAMNLCKIIAGLQPHHVGSACHVMLVARQDMKHDMNMIKIVMAKFNTFTHISKSNLRGWPAGPNGMFGTTMIHIANNNKKNNYECIYWLEPDAVPICPNWFTDLHNVWKGKHPNALIMGCRSDCNGDGTGDHITGCALYHPNIAKLMPEITSCSGTAWDYHCRAKIVARGGHTNTIENWYKATNADPLLVVDRLSKGVRIIHGFKDQSVINLVAKQYGIKL